MHDERFCMSNNFSVGENALLRDVTEYRRNPRFFSPLEGNWYRLTYLPNSPYVVKYAHMDE